MLGITVVFVHARWVAAAAARHAGPSPGARLAPAGRRRRGTSRSGGGWPRRPWSSGSGPTQLGRDRAGPAGGGARLEAGDRRAVQQGRPLRRDRAAAVADAGTGSAGAGPAAADPDPQRGPRAPARRGLVRARAGLAGAGGARSGRCAATRCTPTARRLLISTDDGEWAVPGALTAWHAWEAVRGAVPGAGRQPVGAAGAAPRARGWTPGSAAGCPTRRCRSTFTKHAVRTAQHLRATARAVPPRAGRGAGRWPTGSSPTTPTAGWRWPPALRRSRRAGCGAGRPGGAHRRRRLAG